MALSLGEAELAGVVNGASEGLGIQSVATDLGRRLGLHLHTDSFGPRVGSATVVASAR